MKSFLILMFCLVTITFVSATISSEKMPFRPLTTFQMQKFNSKALFLPSQGNQYKKIQRIIHLMHLMELACLKKYAKPIYFKNRSAYQRPFKTIKPLRMPAAKNDGGTLKDQMPFFYVNRQNQLPLENRRYFGNRRVIYVPPLLKINEKHVNFTQSINHSKIKQNSPSNFRKIFLGQISKEKKNPNEEILPQNKKNIKISEKQANFTKNIEISQLDFRKVLGQKPKEKTKVVENTNLTSENIKFIKLLLPDVVSHEAKEEFTVEHSGVFEDTSKNSESSILKNEKPLKFPNELSFYEIKSTIAPYFKNNASQFFNQTKPNHIQQYEVEEIIEEKVTIDLKNNEGDHFKNFPLNEETIGKKIVLQDNETDIKDLISKSINSVLKSLINPEMELQPSTEKVTKASTNEKFNTWSFRNSPSSLTPRLLRTFSNQQSDISLKNGNEFPFDREKQTKPLNITSTYDVKSHEWRKKTTEAHTSITPELQYDVSNSRLTPTLALGNQKNALTTDVTLTTEKHSKYQTGNVLKTETNIQQTDLIENLHQHTSAMPEIERLTGPVDRPNSEEPFEQASTFGYLDSLDILTEQPNNQSSYFFFVPHETENSFSQPTLTTGNVISEIPITESKKSDSEEFATDNSITPDMPEFTEIYSDEISTTFAPQNTANTTKYFRITTFNEINPTTLDFQNFTDITKTSDLLTTLKSDLKKDKEAVGRTIHFSQEHTETTAFNPISDFENEEQRRSDILITENFSDYVDTDNFSVSSYLHKKKQGSSVLPTDSLLNLTIDSIIPLIPIIINDLREGKISAEDMSVLSKVFDKHWSTVVALANSTNLDMLPLLKMKNEEDFKNVLQNFYQENLEVTTTKTAETRKNDNYEPYDYLDEYKDLYEDVLESETENNEKKRKKYRPKRDEEVQLQKKKAPREHFENADEETQENDFVHEDILYGEISEDEDANVLELRLKVADFDINLKNLFSQTKNKTF